MVSALSTRLLAGSGQKRPFSDPTSMRPDCSVSGYSADREESSLSAPLVSINLLGRNTTNAVRDPHGCPKRRKRNELQFAASSARADLARAGIKFPEMDKDLKNSTKVGEATISLKDVRLVHSCDVKSPLLTSNVSGRSSVSDYEALAASCWDSYATSNPMRTKQSKSFALSHGSDRSTSSVSNESDSWDSNGNGADILFIIPPLLEDGLESRKQLTSITSPSAGSCNIISNADNSVTMGEMMQLSKSAR
jgi:hypothetical protein